MGEARRHSGSGGVGGQGQGVPPIPSDHAAGRPPAGWVVCGVDGSQHAADASWAAARAAARLGLGLQLVRAFDWPPGGIPGLPAGDLGRVVARRSALGELFRLVDSVAAVHPATAAAGALTDGTALDVLTAATATAALTVVGAQGQSAPGGPRAGSVALGITRTTLCPVLVHRAAVSAAGELGGVAVSVDGGPATARLLDVAARSAGRRGDLVVVDDSPSDLVAPDSWAAVGEALLALRAAHPDLRITRRRHRGLPGSMLVELSVSVSLIVVGRALESTRPHLSARVGAVLRRGTCSTLVVPLDRHV